MSNMAPQPEFSEDARSVALQPAKTRAGLTPYHAAYYAHELTRRNSSDSLEKFGPSLFNANVDLNPHQLDAALFAFRSPLSRGAILADEVGLGKTIEAGLIICQLWAERKRRVLVIAPTILRKQWLQELAEKFHIPSVIVDTREYNLWRRRDAHPFDQAAQVVICSYHFAAAHAAEIASRPWDLVTVDEAHRLRNVYKPGSKIASAIKRAVQHRPLLLLTATPLQNTLLELYGLTSFIDEHLFGDLNAFRARYLRNDIDSFALRDLRVRVQPVCTRTLRRQVAEYVRFTNRIPITQDFTPTAEEQALYEKVSAYLQRDDLIALPSSQRKLMTLILRKLLASSTFAIAGTLNVLAERLKAGDPDLTEAVTDDYETATETQDEWPGDETDDAAPAEEAPDARADVRAEIAELTRYGELARSITANAKGTALLNALDLGFRKLEELGANRKAVIFTESRRTQAYLYELLCANGYGGRVLTINGPNNEPWSAAIYREWQERHRGEDITAGSKVVNIRTALVEHFRDNAEVMLATEAAAEGINLQFCSLVVNYDLPWNPQRIEQRIGRCHRYGQTHDVVVINFLNRSNAADQRVFELLDQKFRLFSGVFGSSDEVLGALESGVDFERRVAEIYQICRTPGEIDSAFSLLRQELDEQIAARMADTRAKLLENFDEEVRQRLKLNRTQSAEFLGRLQRLFWDLTRYELRDCATFDGERLSFELHNAPPGVTDVETGAYALPIPGQTIAAAARPYRFGEALAQAVVEGAKERVLPPARLVFDYSGHGEKIGLVEDLVGKQGWLQLSRLTVSSLEDEDHLLFAAITDEGTPVHPEACERMFHVKAEAAPTEAPPADVQQALEARGRELEQETLARIAERNSRFFDQEIDKLERWADDLKHGLEQELKDLDAQIKLVAREARLAASLEDKLALHRQKKELESERTRKRRQLYEAQDDIDARKEELIGEVEGRLHLSTSTQPVAAVRWEIR